MSIDLDWSLLDTQLTNSALRSINSALNNAPKPAFLGDIKATSFSFGKIGPGLEIVDIGEVWEEFLNVQDEDEDDDDEYEVGSNDYDDEEYSGEEYGDGYAYSEGDHAGIHHHPWDGTTSSNNGGAHTAPLGRYAGIHSTASASTYRRASSTTTTTTSPSSAPSIRSMLPSMPPIPGSPIAPSLRHRATSPTASIGAWSSGTGTGSLGLGNRPLHTPSLFTPNAGLWMQTQAQQHGTSRGGGSVASSNLGYPFPRLNYGHEVRQEKKQQHRLIQQHPYHDHAARGRQREDSPFTNEGEGGASASASNNAAAAALALHDTHHSFNDPTAGLSVQLFLRVRYRGNMSLSISTTLKVNYPSPGFMSLPLSLTITGLAFEGLLVLAYEGGHPSPPSSSSFSNHHHSGAALRGETGGGRNAREGGRRRRMPMAARKRVHVSMIDEEDQDRSKPVKGARLLRNAKVESEVGQADKLVLKDVARVEEFVLEMARKALEDEIAWPNFQSFAWT